MNDNTFDVAELKHVAPTSELELLTINRAAKLLHVRPEELVHDMDVFIQSGGRDGLPFISKGKRKVIRAGALKAYLIRKEQKEVAA